MFSKKVMDIFAPEIFKKLWVDVQMTFEKNRNLSEKHGKTSTDNINEKCSRQTSPNFRTIFIKCYFQHLGNYQLTRLAHATLGIIITHFFIRNLGRASVLKVS